jgi:hypothetical protein
MDDYMRLYRADAPPWDLPLRHQGTINGPFEHSDLDGDDFLPGIVSVDVYRADHPARADGHVTQVRFYSDELEKPVPFKLQGFTFVKGEEGLWTLTVTHREYGPPEYDLEYHATAQFGEPVRDAPIFHFDDDKEYMTS